MFALKTRAPVAVVTDVDRSRLQKMIDAAMPYAYVNRSQLVALSERIARARLVPPGAVPANVVTMNSRFRLHHLETDFEEMFTLVFPPQADPFEGRLSVLDPLGTAVLGHRVGDIVHWPIPRGDRRFRIEEMLFQPEREGRFDS